MEGKKLVMILKKEPYQVMVSGEKNEEFRENTAYWRSRLYEKDETPKKFSYVEFSNGYQKNRPQFMVEFKGIEIIDEVDRSYSTGFKVKYPYKKEGYIKIMLGNVLNGQKKEQEKEKKEPEKSEEISQEALYKVCLKTGKELPQEYWENKDVKKLLSCVRVDEVPKKKKKTKAEAGAYDYTKEEEQLVETFVRGIDLSRFDAETIKWLSQPGLISQPQAPSRKKKK